MKRSAPLSSKTQLTTSQPAIDWNEAVREGLLDTAREIVSTYEDVTVIGGLDMSALVLPIIKLRALLWRLDGVITEDDDRRDAGL